MKTDWKQVLIDLHRHGVSQRQIADHLQSNGIAYTKSAVAKLSSGVTAEPPHSAGQAILNLHQQKNPRLSGLKRRDYQVNAEGHITMKYDEVSTEQLAANLEKQVEQLRDTVAFNFANVQIPVNKVDGLHPSCTTLVDDQLESAHSREKAELQKALAARISEVENLAADVAYERLKNETQYQSIGQCFDEIGRLKRLVALRTQDLAVVK